MPTDPSRGESCPVDADVVVAGAGIGGICAAVAAARAGATVTLIEAGDEVGGTGVHSPVGLVCNFRDGDDRPITEGLHREFFPHVYERPVARDQAPAKAWYGPRLETYDHRDLLARYRRALAAPGLRVVVGAPITGVERDGPRIASVRCAGAAGSYAARCFIDATADGNLSALAGCPFQLGRSGDGRLMPATLTFGLRGIDFARFTSVAYPRDRLPTWVEMDAVNAELSAGLRRAIDEGEARVVKEDVFGVPYPDGRSLLFNTTRVLGVDPTRPGSVEEARREAERQAEQVIAAIRRHPACAGAVVDFIAPRLGVREGRRVLGDYVLTEADCLGCARFDDMVAACAYQLDIHNPEGAGTRLAPIPPPGYYHIPYRSLVAAGASNLLLGSRCISGTHEAHSSYRVLASLSAIGQAAGAASAIAARRGGDARAVEAAEIRWILRSQGQFIEGSVRQPEAA